jgi:hypothetical protein
MTCLTRGTICSIWWRNPCSFSTLWSAVEKLAVKDLKPCMSVLSAFFPDMIREAIKDEMANQGVTVEDLREIIRKKESPFRNQ